MINNREKDEKEYLLMKQSQMMNDYEQLRGSIENGEREIQKYK